MKGVDNRAKRPDPFGPVTLRSVLFGTLVLAIAIIIYSFTFAGVGEAQNAGNSADENPHAGVWNDGKAVFSDVALLDIFTRFARGYKPEQPIHYSHKLHVEKNHMECQYCHSGVNKSPFATIPSVELCMGCHKNVSILPDSVEIAKLRKAFEEKKPVEWEAVNNLPEHVFFTHERHVKAGVGCQNCHGQVQKMDVVEKVSTLKMGFCVTCHRERGASIDCTTCHQ